MAMNDEGLDELKSLIAVARKRPVNFAVCLGKKPETTVIKMHRMKEGSILARAAKKEGDTAKITFGEVSVKGKHMTLVCATGIPAGTAKRMKMFLKSINTPMKVTATDADGNLVEDDGEPDEETTDAVPAAGPEAQAHGATDGAGDAAEDEARAKWEAACARIEPKLLEVLKAGKGDVSKMRAVWALADEKAAAGSYDGALQAAAALVKLMSEAGSAQAGDGDGDGEAQDGQEGQNSQKALKARLLALRDEIVSLPESSRGKLVDALKAVTAQFQQGNLQTTASGIERIEAAVNKLSCVEAPQLGIVEKRKFLMTRWQQVPNDLNVEIATLKASIQDRVPYENADEISSLLEAKLSSMTDDMKTAIDDALVQDINSASATYAATSAVIGKLRSEVQRNGLLSELRATPLADGTRFEQAYMSCLDEVQKELTR